MSTIPASQIVSVLPNVLSAGGNALVMNGMMLTQNPRVPIGTFLSFPNDGISVADYFGPSSQEAAIADNYFGGFNTSTQKPSDILFAQYNSAAVAAYLNGGPANQLTLQQLQGISGTLSIVVDGYTHTFNSVDLSSANSFSAAAALLQSGLNNTLAQAATVTGSIAASTASVTGSIAGNVLTVTHVTSGVLVPGASITGTGVLSGTNITSQLSGTTGGIGTYAVDLAQVVPSGTLTSAYGTLTVTAVASGTLAVGQTISGSGITAGTQITGLGTGQGLLGTYYVFPSQTFASGAITASATALTVAFDSVSGGFIISSGIQGAASTAAFATGTTAAALFLTQATGAFLSQGANAATPAGFMGALTQLTQNWATFMTLFDPDGGSGNAQKLAFAQWNNTQKKRWAYIAWDTDITPTASASATSSLGALCAAAEIDGTCCIYSPAQGPTIAAFICGTAASIDFQATNGRITFAFRGQDGITADVTSATVADNLIANGYNFYGVYATAAQNFIMFYPGSVSGEFQWLDSYINQIWLNNAFQLALMVLLQETNSVPYVPAGYDLIKAALTDPVNNGLNFGAIRAGVTLSALQAAQINSAAGVKIDNVLQALGYYIQVKDAQPQVRQARQSPPCTVWYEDGQSVQKIVLDSVLVQ